MTPCVCVRILALMSRMSRKHIPASMANLQPRPGNGHGRGFGSGAHATCERTKRDGQPCTAIAIHGTRFCKVHGARKAAGLPGLRPDVKEAYLLFGRVQPPRELTQQPEWQAAHKGVVKRAALLRAWLAAQEGDWGPWRNLTSIHST